MDVGPRAHNREMACRNLLLQSFLTNCSPDNAHDYARRDVTRHLVRTRLTALWCGSDTRRYAQSCASEIFASDIYYECLTLLSKGCMSQQRCDMTLLGRFNLR
jgi:hypothetical protein